MSSQTFEKFPLKIRNLESEEIKTILKGSFDFLEDVVQVGPQKVVMPKHFADEASYYYNFKFREDDVLVMGFPRSGTTLTQELLWLVFNNFNFKLATEKSMYERVPWLESKSLFFGKTELSPHMSEKIQIMLNSSIILDGMSNRRVIKTHLHFDFLPKSLLTCGCKILYIARNPKDVVVSRYNLHTGFGSFKGTFENYLKFFLSDLTYFGPYWTHLQQGWHHRSSQNVLFFFYEDFIQDRKYFIKKILEFVGEKVTPFQLHLLDFVLQFDNFKKYMAQDKDQDLCNRENMNHNFIRVGKVGAVQEYFTEEMSEEFDRWFEENSALTGIEFPKIK